LIIVQVIFVLTRNVLTIVPTFVLLTLQLGQMFENILSFKSGSTYVITASVVRNFSITTVQITIVLIAMDLIAIIPSSERN